MSRSKARPGRELLAASRLAGVCPVRGRPTEGGGYGTGRTAGGRSRSLGHLFDCSYSPRSQEEEEGHMTSMSQLERTGFAVDEPFAVGPYTGPAVPLAGGQANLPSLFEDASNFELRFVEDYDQIKATVQALKTLNLKVVLTNGSFDILHEGHSMYLEAARRFGHFLIVGVDSDDKIKDRKGPNRPAVPEMERLRMVTHQRGVGLVTLKHLYHPRWHLIKAVEPDVLVATEDTYTEADIRELEAHYCGQVKVLERMATVSTSARLRRIQLGISEPEQPTPAAEPEPRPRSQLVHANM